MGAQLQQAERKCNQKRKALEAAQQKRQEAEAALAAATSACATAQSNFDEAARDLEELRVKVAAAAPAQLGGGGSLCALVEKMAHDALGADLPEADATKLNEVKAWLVTLRPPPQPAPSAREDTQTQPAGAQAMGEQRAMDVDAQAQDSQQKRAFTEQEEALLRKLGDAAQATDDGAHLSPLELQSLLSLVPPIAKRPKCS